MLFYFISENKLKSFLDDPLMKTHKNTYFFQANQNPNTISLGSNDIHSTTRPKSTVEQVRSVFS